MDTLEKIEKHLKITKGIDENTKYVIENIYAGELLTPKRIDLIAKLKLLESIEQKRPNEFIARLYEAHLRAFNGNKKCNEAGNDYKNNLDDYVESFISTANSIKENGFDSNKSLIPVGKNNVLLDGAHRTASAIFYKKNVDIIKFEGINENYSYDFFRKNLLPEKYLDYMVLEYCKRKSNVFAFCIWPSAKKEFRERAYTLIRKETSVLYEKEIDLNYNGYRNFMIQVYKDFTNWIGNYSNHYKGVYSQLNPCYQANIPLKLFVLEAPSKEHIADLKKSIREIFGIGNFSAHSTDNQAETVGMLEILLNENSIELLNFGKPDKYIKLNEKIETINKKINNNNLNKDDFIIDSGAVLGLFGLRDVEDIDYLALTDEYDILEDEMIENHNKHCGLYHLTLEEIILNPENYLVYQGIKFITLDVLRKMKTERKCNKDLLDIKLIDDFRSRKEKSTYFKITKMKIRYIRIKGKIRLLIINLLKSLHLYHYIYSIYKKHKR